MLSPEVFDAAAVAGPYAAAGVPNRSRLALGTGGLQAQRSLAALGRHLDDRDAAPVPVGSRLLAALGPRKLELAATRATGSWTRWSCGATRTRSRRE